MNVMSFGSLIEVPMLPTIKLSRTNTSITVTLHSVPVSNPFSIIQNSVWNVELWPGATKYTYITQLSLHTVLYIYTIVYTYIYIYIYIIISTQALDILYYRIIHTFTNSDFLTFYII